VLDGVAKPSLITFCLPDYFSTPLFPKVRSSPMAVGLSWLATVFFSLTLLWFNFFHPGTRPRAHHDVFFSVSTSLRPFAPATCPPSTPSARHTIVLFFFHFLTSPSSLYPPHTFCNTSAFFDVSAFEKVSCSSSPLPLGFYFTHFLFCLFRHPLAMCPVQRDVF